MQFKALIQLAVLFIVCVTSIGVLVVVRHVTQSDSFGIDGIIATLKDGSMIILGGIIALTKQPHGPTDPTTAAPTAGDVK